MATNHLRGLHARADDDTSTSGRSVRRVHRGVKRDGWEIKAESVEARELPARTPVALWARLTGAHLPVGEQR